MNMTTLGLDPGRTALLCMDFQRDIALAGGVAAPSDDEALARFCDAMKQAEAALALARGAELPVVHVQVAFPPGHPGVNRHTGMGRFLSGSGGLMLGTEGAAIVEPLAPRQGEAVVTKRMVSAFAGTELDMLLRSRGIDTLVLMGLVTHWVVEGTARDAADRGYRLAVLTDCCASGSIARHEAAVDIMGTLATLTKVDELEAALGAVAGRGASSG